MSMNRILTLVVLAQACLACQATRPSATGLDPTIYTADGGAFYSSMPSSSAIDTVLVVRCAADTITSRQRRGNVEDACHRITFSVERVEKGEWSQRTAELFAVDSTPTRESGLKFEQRPWPYRLGNHMR